MKKPLGGGLVVNKMLKDGYILCENREAALELVEWIGPYVFGKKVPGTGLTCRKVRTEYRQGKNWVTMY